VTAEWVGCEDHGVVRIVRIERPDRLNALNEAVLQALGEALDGAVRDGVRALVVTGAGERAFSAGADLDEWENISFADAYRRLELGQLVFQRLAAGPIPAVAAVNGYALGGGMELALACHVRLASRRAAFGLPEPRLGMIPGFGGTQRLPRVVGWGRAAEILLTGRRVPAEEALAIGLVTAVHEEDALLPEAIALARHIAEQSPVSLRMILTALNGGSDLPVERGLLVERLVGAVAASSADQREGVAAFRARRAPRFGPADGAATDPSGQTPPSVGKEGEG
jgi:enoyl-CoA hydratase